MNGVPGRYSVQLVTVGPNRVRESSRDFRVTSLNPRIGRVRRVNTKESLPYFDVSRGSRWRVPVNVEFAIQFTRSEPCLRVTPMLSIR